MKHIFYITILLMSSLCWGQNIYSVNLEDAMQSGNNYILKYRAIAVLEGLQEESNLNKDTTIKVSFGQDTIPTNFKKPFKQPIVTDITYFLQGIPASSQEKAKEIGKEYLQKIGSLIQEKINASRKRNSSK